VRIEVPRPTFREALVLVTPSSDVSEVHDVGRDSSPSPCSSSVSDVVARTMQVWPPWDRWAGALHGGCASFVRRLPVRVVVWRPTTSDLVEHAERVADLVEGDALHGLFPNLVVDRLPPRSDRRYLSLKYLARLDGDAAVRRAALMSSIEADALLVEFCREQIATARKRPRPFRGAARPLRMV